MIVACFCARLCALFALCCKRGKGFFGSELKNLLVTRHLAYLVLRVSVLRAQRRASGFVCIGLQQYTLTALQV